MTNLTPFHLAIPVHDLEKARIFYTETLGFAEGRRRDHWVDLNCFGHQLVIHYQEKTTSEKHHNTVDGKEVPVPHFGVVLEWTVWEEFAKKLDQEGVEFVIKPYIRFKGETGEQATMFFYDPCGNALEFKSFKNMDQLFAS